MDPRLRRFRRPLPALLVVAAFALGARLFALGARVAHQDEGRVADWILHYMAVGQWEYRPIIHGPFLPHVNGVVFDVFGASDFTARLVVAVFGALLPLCAYLYRDHLADDEVVAFGLLLAASAPLLYYSRFMRNDLMVAACMMAALGFWLRARATGKARYLYAGTLPFALAFTMKENALLYPVAWLGSLALVVDRRLLVARLTEDGPGRTAYDLVRDTARDLRPWAFPLVASAAGWFVVVVAFYAPIPEVYGAFTSLDALLSVVGTATLGTWSKFASTWGHAGMSEHSTVDFFARFAKILALTASVTLGFAVVGFLKERYGSTEPRDIVEFCFYWGAASVLGYAIITDIMAGWLATHVVAPLALPAAVGVAWVYRIGKRGYASGDVFAFRVAAAVLLVSAAGVGGVAGYTSYAAPQDPSNPLVQYAQPAGEMKPTLAEVRERSVGHEGIDVLFYGSEFSNPNDLTRQPTLNISTGGYEGWFARLPLPWYFSQYGARVASTTQQDTLGERDAPVIITLERNADEVRETIDTSRYTERTHQGYQHSRPVVFFVRKS
ncbi:flippase activity-associated protein Agl23 [Halarchaeum sp. P4]|uniref:flippase activity-associated protein Agl23 n=1 Tax=Halarchaeum sp. P4 TaxID=3421639 RepID=UPI003EC02B20